MAASPGAPVVSPPPSPFLGPRTPPQTPGPMRVCRLCAKEAAQGLDIFGPEAKDQGLPEKARLCLPVAVSSKHRDTKGTLFVLKQFSRRFPTFSPFCHLDLFDEIRRIRKRAFGVVHHDVPGKRHLGHV